MFLETDQRLRPVGLMNVVTPLSSAHTRDLISDWRVISLGIKKIIERMIWKQPNIATQIDCVCPVSISYSYF